VTAAQLETRKLPPAGAEVAYSFSLSIENGSVIDVCSDDESTDPKITPMALPLLVDEEECIRFPLFALFTLMKTVLGVV
jgi:hypothetical protein